MADLAQAIDEAATIRPADPVLASVAATTRFALALYAAPAERARECHALLFGLRGADSLAPWIEQGVADVDELARLDFEPEHGAGWREAWEARLDELFALLDARLGPNWPSAVPGHMAHRAHGAETSCCQSASRPEGLAA